MKLAHGFNRPKPVLAQAEIREAEEAGGGNWGTAEEGAGSLCETGMGERPRLLGTGNDVTGNSSSIEVSTSSTGTSSTITFTRQVFWHWLSSKPF